MANFKGIIAHKAICQTFRPWKVSVKVTENTFFYPSDGRLMWVKTDFKSAGGRNRETFLMIWVMRKSEKGMKGVKESD